MKLSKPNLALCLLLVASMLPSIAFAEEPVDFNRDIRPILAENCFYCHGQDSNKRQAELRLDIRELALQSSAFVPGQAADSSLIARIHSTDAESQMPPPKSNRKLSIDQKKLLAKWIDQGAAYSNHWAFIAPVRPELPRVSKSDWPRTPVDHFVLSTLEAEGLTPSPEAD